MTAAPLRTQNYEKYTVVEIDTNTLMDPLILEAVGSELYRLVDQEDRRQMILDFEKVQYISSQAIGILLQLNKKLAALPRSALILCSVNQKLMDLLKIVRLDRLLKIKPTQQEAVKQFAS
jgi:anti-sigma B factor antagonist